MKKVINILSPNQILGILLIAILILLTSVSEILLLLFIEPTLQILLNIKAKTYNFEFFSFRYNFDTRILFLFFISVFLLRNIFYALTTIVKNRFIINLHINTSNKIYSSYLSKSYIFFLRNNSSKLISNVINEVNFFCYNVLDGFFIFSTEIFLILAIVFFLFYNFFQFSLILLLFCFLLFFLSIFFYKKKLKKIGLERSRAEKIKIDNLQKSFYAIQSIKLDNIENFFIKKYNDANAMSVKKLAFLNIFNDLHKPIWETIILVSFVFSVYVGYNFFGLFRTDLVLILGTFTIALFRFLPSLNRILNSYNMFKFYSPSIDIIHQELLYESDFIFKEKENIVNFKFFNQIELNNVSFQYSDKLPFILDKINLTIKHNSITFIKGESGSGKSTLLNIICGLLLPTTGEVLMNGKNISSFLKSYQSKIGYVPQKTLLSDDSVLENIIFGQRTDNLDLNLVKEVIRRSKLDKLIDKLPNGLNTIIGERGSSFSGGEQQRVGIARALYKKPEILILDEATSALDPETESFLLEELLELQKYITIIMVSHKKLEISKKFELFDLQNCNIFKK
jgi:ABC-type bacteriocin/lantibiotic exporter with double-glycine peptidase domain